MLDKFEKVGMFEHACVCWFFREGNTIYYKIRLDQKMDPDIFRVYLKIAKKLIRTKILNDIIDDHEYDDNVKLEFKTKKNIDKDYKTKDICEKIFISGLDILKVPDKKSIKDILDNICDTYGCIKQYVTGHGIVLITPRVV